MSDNEDKSFADRIVEMDRALREKMDAAHGESDELYKLYNQRLDNYTVAQQMPIDDLTKVLFSSMKSDVILEIAIFKLRKDFDEQISKIITRLDNIEDNIKAIIDGLKTNEK